MNKQLQLKDWVFEIGVTPQMMNAHVAINELLETHSVKATLRYVADNQDTLYQILLNVIREDYDDTFKLYGEEEDLPKAENDDELKKLFKPLHVTIHDTAKNGFNYVGFGFDAVWQEEHGIGVLLYKDRVVQHGGEDHSFLEYMATDDAELG